VQEPLVRTTLGELCEFWRADLYRHTGETSWRHLLTHVLCSDGGERFSDGVKYMFYFRLCRYLKTQRPRLLFVTVDPERDTDAVMADYAKAFSPQVVGLRGSPNALANLARTYRVAYEVKEGPPYEVIHSNAVFFFDRDGRARLVTTDTSDTAAMAEDVTRLLRQQ